MALIKCPECGRDVSDRAYSCIHCGYPIVLISINKQEVQTAAKSVAIIYGLHEISLIEGRIKLYVDGEYVTSVKKWGSVEIPVERDCVLTAKCGIYLCKGRELLMAGRTTKIQIVYHKKSGTFKMINIHES